MDWIRARLLLYFTLFSLLTVTPAGAMNATEVELLHTQSRPRPNLDTILSRNNAGLLLQDRHSDKCGARKTAPRPGYVRALLGLR